MNKPRQNFVTPLHLAATSGDLRIVEKLVENNARINALDGDQATPLHRATAYDNHKVIEYLVKKYVMSLPYTMKKYTEFNLATWFRLGKIHGIKYQLTLILKFQLYSCH